MKNVAVSLLVLLAVAPLAKAQTVLPLWPAGSPTLQGANEKEITNPADPKPGQRINSIKNVHTPTIRASASKS